jgi:hypothetical protein
MSAMPTPPQRLPAIVDILERVGLGRRPREAIVARTCLHGREPARRWSGGTGQSGSVFSPPTSLPLPKPRPEDRQFHRGRHFSGHDPGRQRLRRPRSGPAGRGRRWRRRRRGQGRRRARAGAAGSGIADGRARRLRFAPEPSRPNLLPSALRTARHADLGVQLGTDQKTTPER